MPYSIHHALTYFLFGVFPLPLNIIELRNQNNSLNLLLPSSSSLNSSSPSLSRVFTRVNVSVLIIVEVFCESMISRSNYSCFSICRISNLAHSSSSRPTRLLVSRFMKGLFGREEGPAKVASCACCCNQVLLLTIYLSIPSTMWWHRLVSINLIINMTCL